MMTMRKTFIRSILPLALLLLPGLLKAEPPAGSPPLEQQDTQYAIRFLDLHAAEVLAWDQCPQKERCRVVTVLPPSDSKLKGYLGVRADAVVLEKIARALAKADGNPRGQSFQLLLLAAGTKARNGGPEVPANVQKALAELKGFLPFKGYELLDSTWMHATQDRVTEARLVGRDGASYDVTLLFRAPSSGDLFIDGFRLKAEPFTPTSPGGVKETRNTQPSRILIDTTFGIKTGETVVVGTSKVDGSDEALVVLLTAVPAP
jgi:hypothetical protein